MLILLSLVNVLWYDRVCFPVPLIPNKDLLWLQSSFLSFIFAFPLFPCLQVSAVVIMALMGYSQYYEDLLSDMYNCWAELGIRFYSPQLQCMASPMYAHASFYVYPSTKDPQAYTCPFLQLLLYTSTPTYTLVKDEQMYMWWNVLPYLLCIW